MELVLPSVKYRDSYLAAAKEFTQEDSVRYKDIYGPAATEDFGRFVEKRKAMMEGKELPTGWVPVSDYWLIDNGEYIGRVSVRHLLNDNLLNIGGHIGYDIRPSQRHKGYGKKILELALPKAKELDIIRVLVTCDETNEASRKIIEANGGVFEDKRPNPEGGPEKLRYWIQL